MDSLESSEGDTTERGIDASEVLSEVAGHLGKGEDREAAGKLSQLSEEEQEVIREALGQVPPGSANDICEFMEGYGIPAPVKTVSSQT